jgi:hypothetical protein
LGENLLFFKGNFSDLAVNIVTKCFFAKQFLPRDFQQQQNTAMLLSSNDQTSFFVKCKVGDSPDTSVTPRNVSSGWGRKKSASKF